MDPRKGNICFLGLPVKPKSIIYEVRTRKDTARDIEMHVTEYRSRIWVGQYMRNDACGRGRGW